MWIERKRSGDLVFGSTFLKKDEPKKAKLEPKHEPRNVDFMGFFDEFYIEVRKVRIYFNLI